MTTQTRSNSNTGDAVTREVDADQPASLAVVEAVAAVSGRSPTAAAGEADPLEPLFEAVDPEALDALVDASAGADGRAVEVAFEYAGHDVTVEAADATTVTVE